MTRKFSHTDPYPPHNISETYQKGSKQCIHKIPFRASHRRTMRSKAAVLISGCVLCQCNATTLSPWLSTHTHRKTYTQILHTHRIHNHRPACTPTLTTAHIPNSQHFIQTSGGNPVEWGMRESDAFYWHVRYIDNHTNDQNSIVYILIIHDHVLAMNSLICICAFPADINRHSLDPIHRGYHAILYANTPFICSPDSSFPSSSTFISVSIAVAVTLNTVEGPVTSIAISIRGPHISQVNTYDRHIDIGIENVLSITQEESRNRNNVVISSTTNQ